MKVAFIFFGISYNKCIHHWAGNFYKIDYRESLENYKKYLWKYFKKDEIDVFFSTYKSEKSEELLKDYKPKAHNFFPELNYLKKNKRIGKNSNMIKAMDVFLNYQKKNQVKYDICVVTRFDLLFKLPFHESKINLNKFNITFKFGTKICDNLYIMPFDYANSFHQIIKNYGISNNHHYLKGTFEKKFVTNYALDHTFKTKHLSAFYTFNRIKPNEYDMKKVINDENNIKKNNIIKIKNIIKQINIKHMNIKHMNIKHMNIKQINIKHMNIKHMNIKHMNIKHMNIKHMNIKPMNKKQTNKKSNNIKLVNIKSNNIKNKIKIIYKKIKKSLY